VTESQLRILRWALTPVAAWAGWTAALVVGWNLYSTAERMCPAQMMVSGICVAPWFSFASATIICLGAALAAVLVVVGVTWVAPADRRVVSRVIYLIGAITAIALGVASAAWLELASALVAGAIAVALIDRREKRPLRSLQS
jgi:hypothetical protein